MRPSLLNTGAPDSRRGDHDRGLGLGGSVGAVAQSHRDLSPADVDPGLEEVVRHRVQKRADLQLADAEDAYDADGDVREEALGLQGLGGQECHMASNSQGTPGYA